MNVPNENIHVIITRYREYIDWIQYLPESVTKIFIYNKGPKNSFFKDYTPSELVKSKLEVIPIENVGRINHSLAFHIINNWESLPDQLISLPGTILMSQKKGLYLSKILNVIKNGNIKDYKGFYSPRFQTVGKKYNYSIKESPGLIKSDFSDLKDFNKNVLSDESDIRFVSLRSTFIVSKDNILFNDKNIFVKILLSLSVGDNSTNGYFVERLWAHIFKKIGNFEIENSEEIPKNHSKCLIT